MRILSAVLPVLVNLVSTVMVLYHVMISMNVKIIQIYVILMRPVPTAVVVIAVNVILVGQVMAQPVQISTNAVLIHTTATPMPLVRIIMAVSAVNVMLVSMISTAMELIAEISMNA